MITLTPFTDAAFDDFIHWLDDEKLLITIAGSYFSHPLTHAQLHRYLADETSRAFNIVYEGKAIGHAEIITINKELYKIDKLIIGDVFTRGKGLGEKAVQALVDYCFNELQAEAVELNVYDWNIGAMKCYTKVGFADTGNRLQTTVGDETWVAINMLKQQSE